ncbi:NAD(P)H-dependent oxidoreductase [Candidatus Gracilibacteria bacterium]|nr:NAD(P)H-dependent oxidoreductase [Candidatus Gracilibacteria bacterium]MCF7818989.1 NAD(P)H-dependent oxidoreductase [Candidatus Gracilibacteria bacterium]
MKSLVLITAHPDSDSLCKANADALEKAGKKQKFTVHRYSATEYPLLPHNPIRHGFPKIFDDPTQKLTDCDVVVVVCPMWNFGAPAALKNFLDGVIQSKKLFRFVPHPILKFLASLPGMGKIIPEARPVGLMKARRVLCVWTADGPEWYYRLFWWKNVLFSQVKRAFQYCGVKKIDQKILGMTRKRSEKEIQSWLNELENYKW